MNSHSKRSNKFVAFLGSRRFFTLTIVLFVVEASWIALSARYPQAFDEQFHLGIIKLYAHQWGPFFSHQPAGADMFGAVARDPSYLYHYLMSFPYRLIAHFTGNLTVQVIVLRFINIALLGSTLPIFRRMLRYTKASPTLINLILFGFVLTPVVPLLASQINYDNLTIPLTGLAIWCCLRFLHHRQNDKTWRWDIVLQLTIIGLLGSLVKYAFLPIFAALVLVILIAWFRRSQQQLQYVWPGRLKLVSLIAVGLVSLGLCIQMYGVNTVRYHTPIPECDQVLSMQRCQAYSPWARNHTDQQHKLALSPVQIAGYPLLWAYRSVGELVFTVASGFNDTGGVDYWVGTQFIVMEVLVWIMLGAGGLLALYYAKHIWRQEVLRVFLIVTGLYVLALLGQNYLDYLKAGRPEAIHGRYLLPVLPLIYAIVALAISYAINTVQVTRFSNIKRQAGIAAVMMVLLLIEGGGFVTYIVRSDPNWFWPQSASAQSVNAGAQKVLKPLVLDIGKKQE
jgi:hypothetical protein